MVGTGALVGISAASFSILVLLAVAMAPRGAHSLVDFYNVTDASNRNATCNDGGDSCYYFSPGNNSGTFGWVIILEQGVPCWSNKTCNVPGTCQGRPVTLTQVGLFERSCTTNPTFCHFNQLWLVDCSSDLFLGEGGTTRTILGTPMTFNGLYILDAVVEDMLDSYGMVNNASTEILFVGQSWQASSVLMTVDHLKHKYWSDIARVWLLADAGFEIVQFDDPPFYTGPEAGAPNMYTRLQRPLAWNANLSISPCTREFGEDDYDYCLAVNYAINPVQAAGYPTFLNAAYMDHNIGFLSRGVTLPPNTTIPEMVDYAIYYAKNISYYACRANASATFVPNACMIALSRSSAIRTATILKTGGGTQSYYNTLVDWWTRANALTHFLVEPVDFYCTQKWGCNPDNAGSNTCTGPGYQGGFTANSSSCVLTTEDLDPPTSTSSTTTVLTATSTSTIFATTSTTFATSTTTVASSTSSIRATTSASSTSVVSTSSSATATLSAIGATTFSACTAASTLQATLAAAGLITTGSGATGPTATQVATVVTATTGPTSVGPSATGSSFEALTMGGPSSVALATSSSSTTAKTSTSTASTRSASSTTTLAASSSTVRAASLATLTSSLSTTVSALLSLTTTIAASTTGSGFDAVESVSLLWGVFVGAVFLMFVAIFYFSRRRKRGDSNNNNRPPVQSRETQPFLSAPGSSPNTSIYNL